MHKLKEAELIFNLVLNQNLSLLTAMVSPKREEVLLNNGDIQDGLTDKVPDAHALYHFRLEKRNIGISGQRC